MSKISGGLGQCFDTVRDAIDEASGGGVSDEIRALNSIEEAFERRVRYVHEARGLAHRLTGMLEAQIAWLRQERAPWSVELKQRGDELETQLMTELGVMSFSSMRPKALVELGVAVAAELERRGITSFPVQLGGDGKIHVTGGAAEGEDG